MHDTRFRGRIRLAGSLPDRHVHVVLTRGDGKRARDPALPNVDGVGTGVVHATLADRQRFDRHITRTLLDELQVAARDPARFDHITSDGARAFRDVGPVRVRVPFAHAAAARL